MNNQEFKVGQKVSVVSSNEGVTAISTVATVGAAKIILADKSEWKAKNGHRWGSTTRYSYYYTNIRPWAEGDDEKLQHFKDVCTFGTIHHIDARSVSSDRLHAIAELIREHRAEAERKKKENSDVA